MCAIYRMLRASWCRPFMNVGLLHNNFLTTVDRIEIVMLNTGSAIVEIAVEDRTHTLLPW
jgi:hypothetical protein